MPERTGHGPRYVDMPPDAEPVRADDWIWTNTGSRYIVRSVTGPRGLDRDASCHDDCPAHVLRYGLRCERLPKHTPIPDDVRAILFHHHAHGRRMANA